MNKNYSDIWNMCSNYDNKHSGVLTDRIQELDFVDEEILEYIVSENSTSLCRLRCFLGTTYEDDLYRLDGYGNLTNLEKDDLEELLDDLVDNLNRNIYTLTAQKEACL